MSWPRRASIAVAATVVVVLAAAAVGWYAVLPRWRPSLRPGERYAVDVSSYQGSIDWARVAGAGHVRAAYLKASEGGDLADPRFATNRAGAEAAGVAWGPYAFFTLCTPGADQAAELLRVLGTDRGQLAPAVDLELAGNCSARPAQPAFLQQLQAFLTAVDAATGRTTVLYVGSDLASRYPGVLDLGRPRWVRRLWRRPTGPWVAWQASYRADVPGIRGGVDLDVLAG